MRGKGEKFNSTKSGAEPDVCVCELESRGKHFKSQKWANAEQQNAGFFRNYRAELGIFSNILSFFCAFFLPQNEKSSSDSGSNVCAGSSSRVQMDTHLSIINMPLSASGVPS